MKKVLWVMAFALVCVLASQVAPAVAQQTYTTVVTGGPVATTASKGVLYFQTTQPTFLVREWSFADTGFAGDVIGDIDDDTLAFQTNEFGYFVAQAVGFADDNNNVDKANAAVLNYVADFSNKAAVQAAFFPTK